MIFAYYVACCLLLVIGENVDYPRKGGSYELILKNFRVRGFAGKVVLCRADSLQFKMEPLVL